MEQLELIHEDIYEAMKSTCRLIGGGKKNWAKVVGHLLWPEKSPDDAGKLLNNCLDRQRAEKLDPEQFLFLLREGRKNGIHMIMDFIADDSSYSYSPIEPRDEIAELQASFIKSVEENKRLMERLQRAQIRLNETA